VTRQGDSASPPSENEVDPAGSGKRGRRLLALRTRVSAAIEETSPHLLDYFSRRVSPVEDAADLLGDTLLVVWRKAASMPADETEARMWMFGIARKVLSTHWRGSRRRNALSARLRAHIATQATTSGVDGRASTSDGDLHEQIRASVRGLSLLDREIIMLVHWEGFSLEEAASIMNMKPATVRSRHLRARAHLKEMLNMAESPT